MFDGGNRLVDQAGWSSTGVTAMFGGSVALISSSFAPTSAATAQLLPPMSIRAVPITALLAVERSAAVADFLAHEHVGHVADVHRHTSAFADDDALDLVECRQQPTRADLQRLAVLLDVLGPDGRVVAFERVDEVAERQAVTDELHRVGLDAVLLDVPADRVDAGHVVHLPELRGDRVLLKRPQVRRLLDIRRQRLALGVIVRVGCIIGVTDGVHVDLAQPRADRPHRRLGAHRQVVADAGEPFEHLRPGEVDVGVVGEDGRHLGKTVAADRPRVVQPFDAGQRRLTGKVICFSTCSGPSASYSVLIWTWLLVMSGTASMGSLVSDQTPTPARRG